MRCLILSALLVACSSELPGGFEASLTRGHACGEDFVVLADEAETMRLQASFSDYAGTPIPEGERLVVFTGARLMHFDSDPCDDQIEDQLLALGQHIACRYDQVAGVVTAELDGGEIAVVTEEVRLAPTPGYGAACDGHPDVDMADGALVAVPL